MSEGRKTKPKGQVRGRTKFKIELVGASYPGYAAQHVSKLVNPIYFPTCQPWEGQDAICEFAINGIRFYPSHSMLIRTGDQPILRIEVRDLDGTPIDLDEVGFRINAA